MPLQWDCYQDVSAIFLLDELKLVEHHSLHYMKKYIKKMFVQIIGL